MRPDTPRPRVGVEHGGSEDAPLLSFPSRVKPEWLRKHPEDACPPSPALSLVLREPDSDDAG
jgi:hypothetical protein